MATKQVTINSWTGFEPGDVVVKYVKYNDVVVERAVVNPLSEYPKSTVIQSAVSPMWVLQRVNLGWQRVSDTLTMSDAEALEGLGGGFYVLFDPRWVTAARGTLIDTKGIK